MDGGQEDPEGAGRRQPQTILALAPQLWGAVEDFHPTSDVIIAGHSKRTLDTYIHSGIIHHGQKAGTTQVSAGGQMKNQKVNTCSGKTLRQG